jgi:O-antigen ligase
MALGGAGVLVLMHYPSVSLGLFSYAYVIRGGLLLPGGINLTVVFLVATVAGVLLQVQPGRPLRFRLTHWDLWVALFTLAVVVGSTYGDPDFARVKAMRFAVLVSLPYFLARVVLTEPPQVRRFLTVVFLAAVVVGIVLVATYLFPTFVPRALLEGTEDAGRGRFSFLEANSIPVATLFMVGAALGLSQIRSLERTGKWGMWGLVVLLIFATMLTGTRGSIVATLLVLGLVGTASFVRSPARATLIALLVLGVVLASATQFYRLPNWDRFESLSDISQDQALTTRLDLQAEALAMFSEDPALGLGTGSVRNQYPHNIFIEVAAENGLVGLVPLAMLIVLVLGRTRRYMFAQRWMPPEQASMVFAVLLPLIGLLMVKQFSFELTTHKDLFVFFALAVNLPYLLSRIAGEQEQRPLEADKPDAGVLAGHPSPA